MGEKTDKPIGEVRDYGRKPYMYGRTHEPYKNRLKGSGDPSSYREQMSRVSEFAMNRAQQYKSSELKKPYWSDDFTDMEHFFSPFIFNWWWDFYDFEFEPMYFSGESGGSPPYSPPWCSSVTRKCSWSVNTFEEDMFTHLKLYHGPDGDGFQTFIDIDDGERWRIRQVETGFADNQHSQDFVDIKVTWDNGDGDTDCNSSFSFTVRVVWNSLCKEEECEKKVTIECEDPCETATPMTWDYPDTGPPILAQSAQADISVDGGLGPYSWTIAGSGWWLNSARDSKTASTSGPTVTVYTDEDACGAGTLSVEDQCMTLGGGTALCSADSHWSTLRKSDGAENVYNATCETSGASMYGIVSGNQSVQYYHTGKHRLTETVFWGSRSSSSCLIVGCGDGSGYQWCVWEGKCITNSGPLGLQDLFDHYSVTLDWIYDSNCCYDIGSTPSSYRCVSMTQSTYDEYVCD